MSDEIFFCILSKEDNLAEQQDEQEKLKNLEKALAQELDQEVKLTSPGDIRLSSDVDMNPAIASTDFTKAVDATEELANNTKDIPSDKIVVQGDGADVYDQTRVEVAGQHDDEKELTLEELDKVFDAESPAFLKELGEVAQEVKKTADGHEISDEPQDSKQSEAELAEAEKSVDASPAIQNLKEKLEALKAKLKPDELIEKLRKEREALPERIAKLGPTFWQLFKKFLYITKEKILDFLELIKKGLLWFAALSRPQLFMVFLILTLVGTIYMFSRMMIHGTFMPKVRPYILPDVKDEADSIYEIKKEDGWSKFSDPMNAPEFTVAINRIVVNIKPSQNSGPNPMTIVELIILTSNQEAAIEIKKRMSEVRDMVSRIVEEITYDDLARPEGKEKLKMFIRKDLNQIINSGRVAKVLYKSVVIKP